MSGPWNFDEARDKCRAAAAAQEQAESSMREASRDAAQAEEAYRVALAQSIIYKHDEGVAWSVAPDLARGDKRVADLRRKRDIAVGVRDAMTQLGWRRNADRKDAQRFADWSQRREIAEGYAGEDAMPSMAWSRS